MTRPTEPNGPPAFDDAYYERQGLDRDRLALWYYARVARRLFAKRGRVLDFGCGTGHLLRRLSQSFEAYGYDVSAPSRARCRENAPDAVVLEEWESLPVGALDGIVTLHTLEHVQRPLGIVTALVKRLTDRGRVLVVVPNTGSPGRAFKGDQWFALRDPTHCSLLSRGEWATILRRAGLRILWIRGDGMWDTPYVRWLPAATQRPIFGAPAALQIMSPIAQPFLPASFGECLIIAAEKE